MFWGMLAIEVVGLAALFAALAFFQQGQAGEHLYGWSKFCKSVGIGAAVMVIVVFGFGLTSSLNGFEIALLVAPMVLLILMFAALVDQPSREE